VSARAYVNIHDETKSPYALIFALAWPVMIEQLLTFMVQYVDTAMVGSLGAHATAAVSLCATSVFLVSGVALALGIGVTAVTSRAVGAGQNDLIRTITSITVFIAVCWGLLGGGALTATAFALPRWMGGEEAILSLSGIYNFIGALGQPFRCLSTLMFALMRGAGNTKSPMRINLAVNLLNMVGNFLLIYPTRQLTLLGVSFTMPGAGWGVAGAAAATSLACLYGAVASLAVVFKPGSPLKTDFKSLLHPNFRLLKQVGSISAPAMLERIAQSTADIFLVAALATLGSVSVAANQLFSSAQMVMQIPSQAFSIAATTFVGQFLGAARPDKAVSYTKRCVGLTLGCAIVIAFGLYVFAFEIIRFLTPDPATIDLAGRCMRISVWGQPLNMAYMALGGALRGAGDTKSVFWIGLSCHWTIRTLGTMLLIRVLGWDLMGLVLCIFIDNALRLTLCILRFAGGKWKTMIKTIQT